MRTLTFFNNKGGVGKTTLACNYAHYASRIRGLRTLLIDLDPQANATQLLLTEKQWEGIYEDHESSPEKTILKAFSEIEDGDSSVNTEVITHASERFGVDVLAGHPSLSRMEDFLSSAWIDFRGELPAGARKTNWLTTLRESLQYDLVVIDLGPSLGALNRSTLVASTNFITPVSADLFSLYALENIGTWANEWFEEYEDAMQRTIRKSKVKGSLSALPGTPRCNTGYIGYTVQQYVAKKSGGALRPTAAYDKYKKQIPDRARKLQEFSTVRDENLALGIIPNMFSMIPLAQSVHAPISSLTTSDGVRGAQVYQQERYSEDLAAIFERLTVNMGVTA